MHLHKRKHTETISLKVVKMSNSTTNLRVGRSNRSGRATQTPEKPQQSVGALQGVPKTTRAELEQRENLSALVALEFAVPGTPCAKGRPRFDRRTGRAFTPAKTKQAENTFAARAFHHAPAVPISGPLALGLVFALPIPKSWSKKKRSAAQTGELLPTGRPDLDNLCKLAKDAMNGAFWLDDSQVTTLEARKTYADIPSTFVSIFEIGGAA